MRRSDSRTAQVCRCPNGREGSDGAARRRTCGAPSAALVEAAGRVTLGQDPIRARGLMCFRGRLLIPGCRPRSNAASEHQLPMPSHCPCASQGFVFVLVRYRPPPQRGTHQRSRRGPASRACALDGSQRPEMTAFVRQSRSPTTNQPAIAFYGSLGATWTPKTSPWPPLTHGEAFGRPVKFLGGTRPKLVPEIARGRESLYNAHK
jgi:putative hemolysin